MTTRLGSLLVRYRDDREIGVRSLASEIGISHATLNRIERGRPMDLKTFLTLWAWLIQREVDAE